MTSSAPARTAARVCATICCRFAATAPMRQSICTHAILVLAISADLLMLSLTLDHTGASRKAETNDLDTSLRSVRPLVARHARRRAADLVLFSLLALFRVRPH